MDVINKPLEVNIGAEFESKALRILRSIPELKPVPSGHRLLRADATVRYADMETPVAIEFKARVSSATAHQIVHQASQSELPMVVIADAMTSRAREILDEAGIGSVDGLGNIHLALPGLLMKVTGTKRRPRPPANTRLSGKSGLVAQAMLLEVERSWNVSELAKRCRTSPALVHRVLQRLEREGVVTAHGAGPSKTRRLSNPAALLDLWAEEQRDPRWRQPAFLLAQTTDQLIHSLCDGLEATTADYALTGAAAARTVAPFITNVLVAHVWLSSAIDASDVCEQIRATPVDSGPNVVFLQEHDDTPLAFRARRDGVWTTNVFRLYSDLLRDPRRGREQSDHLREQEIRF